MRNTDNFEIKDGQVANLAKLANSSDSGMRFSPLLQPEELPGVLRSVMELHSDAAECDMMMLGVMNILSGMAASFAGDERSAAAVYGIYGNRRVYSPLYNIVYARAGSGKGTLVHCMELLRPMRTEMKRQYELELADYRQRLAEYEAARRKTKAPQAATPAEQPQEPPYRSPLVAGNSTSAAFYRSVCANGGWALMFETEADTVTQMLRSDFGNYSDLLRKAFHHEPLSMHRATDNLHIDIEEPRLSVMLTCTPGQLPQLFAGNAENGMASRFLYYGLPSAAPVFKNVFANAEKPLEDEYRQIAASLSPLSEALRQREGRPLQFVLAPHQQQLFLERFGSILQGQTELLGDAYQGFVFRLALSCFRYAMTLTLLRRLDERRKTGVVFRDDEVALQCDDRDCQASLVIVETLARHTALVFSAVMPEAEDPFTKNMKQMDGRDRLVLERLPKGVFRSSDFAELAASASGVSARTARRMLSQFVYTYGVIRQLSFGFYQRADQCGEPAAPEGSQGAANSLKGDNKQEEQQHR